MAKVWGTIFLAAVASVAAGGDGGVFGSWMTDSFGGAAYAYTLDHTVDPRAVSNDTDAYFRLPREHNFVVGNFRVTAHASNYGYLQVRADDSSPAWLGEASGVHPGSEAVRQYGLGWGFLFDDAADALVLSTWYDGAHSGTVDAFERVFGLGYSVKRVTAGGLEVEQTVVAPYGDDPVLVSLVTVTNRRAAPAVLHWVENAGGAVRVLDNLAGEVGRARSPAFGDGRAFARAHYVSVFSPLPALGRGGERQERVWVPLNASEEAAYAELVADTPVGIFGGPPMPGPPRGAAVWPTALPATSLVDISPPQAGVGAPDFGNDCSAFFGSGGRAAPSMLRMPINLPRAAPPVSNDDGCVLVASALTVPVGGSVTLAVLWAYDAAGEHDGLSTLVARYTSAVAAGTLVSDTVAAWLSVSTRVEGAPQWLAREALWHSYMLLAAASYDSSWGERMIDQGTGYRYVTGAQIAVRDPSQHLLGALASAPALSRSVLRYLLGLVMPSAAAALAALGTNVSFLLPYGAANVGEITNLALRPSDQELYLVYAASEYFFSTRDAAFFDEPLTLYGDSAPTTVVAALLRCLDYSVRNVSVGRHGLMRLQTSDWSDSFCVMFEPGCRDGPSSAGWKSMFDEGESVLNAAMAAYVLPRFADVLDSVGGGRYVAAASTARAFAAAQAAALTPGGDAWSTSGPWLRRAFLSNDTGFVGEHEVFGTQHAWALLAGVIKGDAAAALVETLAARLSAPSAFGMPVLAPPRADATGQALGEGENGGVWPALNHPLIIAFSGVNATLAWDEWTRNSLHTSALVWPEYWASIWSSSDSSNGPAAAPTRQGRAGSWVSSWPTQCQHRHAWPLVSLVRLAGVSFDAGGLVLAPGDAAPGGAGGAGAGAPWALHSPAASIARTGRSAWEGHWAPDPRAGALRGGGSGTAQHPLALRGALPVAPGVRTCDAAVACAGAQRAHWRMPPARTPSTHEVRRLGAGNGSPFALVDLALPVGVRLDACKEVEWEVVCA